jgi:hypothetical protein
MVRKMKYVALSLLLLSLQLPVMATTPTTVGGTKRVMDKVSSFPANGPTLTCNSVALTTFTVTAVLAANADRLAFWVVNRSTLTHCPSCSTIDDRPSFVAISTGSTMNLSVGPTVALGMVRSNFNKLNAKILRPSITTNMTGPSASGLAEFGMTGGSVYTGALYGVAEASGTATVDVLGRVEACQLVP